MKKLIYVLATLLVLTFPGCSKENIDLLDKASSGDLNADNVFPDYFRAQQFLLGIYSNMPFSWTVFNMGLWDGITSDMIPRNAWSGHSGFVSGALSPTNLIRDYYTTYYRGIRGANLLLENAHRIIVPEYITDPEQEIGKMKMEARFCRAFIYASMFEFQGGCVILTKSSDPKGEPEIIQRSTYEETANWICAEMDTLATMLPEQWDPIYYGKPTKGAALATKARVLIHLASPAHNTNTPYGDDPHFMVHAPYDKEKWKRAADACKAVIDMGIYSLRPGRSGYYSVWNDQSNNNKEYIFARTTIVSNLLEYEYLPLSARFTGGKNGGAADMFVTQNMVDEYEVLEDNAGEITAVPFDWNNPAHAADPYRNRDPRFKLCIRYNGSKYLGHTVETFIGGADRGECVTGYYMRKFQDSTINLSTGGNNVHPFPYIRYSDILLMHAEALNEYYDTPPVESFDAVNMVRNRVGMPSLPAGLNKDEMRERIRKERHVEMAFEQRYIFDVRRWLIMDTQKYVYRCDIVKNTDNSFSYAKVLHQTNNYLPKHVMWPIPEADIMNAGLYQNPLY